MWAQATGLTEAAVLAGEGESSHCIPSFHLHTPELVSVTELLALRECLCPWSQCWKLAAHLGKGARWVIWVLRDEGRGSPKAMSLQPSPRGHSQVAMRLQSGRLSPLSHTYVSTE